MTDLIIEYEAMSQEGAVVFLEKKEFLTLIEYYEKKYNIDRALEVVEHALAQHSFSADIYVRKAQLLLEQGCYEEVLDTISKASILDNSVNTIALPIRIRALINLQLIDEASEELVYFRTYFNDSFSEATACYFEALIMEQKGEFLGAFEALQQALYIAPNHIEALSYIGIVVEYTGLYEECAQVCKTIINHNPYNALAWYYLGNAYSGMERFEKAFSCYEYAFLSDPTFELGYKEAIVVSNQLKWYFKCIDICEDYHQQFGDDSFVASQLGIAYIHTDKIKQGRKILNVLLRKDDQNEEILYNLGISFVKEGKHEKAISYFERAFEVNELQDEYLSALAEAYNQAGYTDEAIECYREVTEMAPEIWSYWVQYATILMENGEEEAAIELLEEAELNAYCPELTFVKVSCLLTMGRRKEGLNQLANLLEEYYEKYPIIFELLPQAQQDTEILSIITAYKPCP
ncbi:MAG: tetratricopeptide repeat protein [Saprospiraceae bacterium]|nr:tetratricopeptide repeat protein [Saprospiraceae bacterium]